MLVVALRSYRGIGRVDRSDRPRTLTHMARLTGLNYGTGGDHAIPA